MSTPSTPSKQPNKASAVDTPELQKTPIAQKVEGKPVKKPVGKTKSWFDQEEEESLAKSDASSAEIAHDGIPIDQDRPSHNRTFLADASAAEEQVPGAESVQSLIESPILSTLAQALPSPGILGGAVPQGLGISLPAGAAVSSGAAGAAGAVFSGAGLAIGGAAALGVVAVRNAGKNDKNINLNLAPEGEVTITGTPKHSQTLQATSTVTDANGIPSTGAGARKFQWLADGQAIEGATEAFLTLGQAQVGKVISVQMSYTDNGGTVETVKSAGTVAVSDLGNTIPTLTGLPTSVQSATVGQPAALADFTVADADSSNLRVTLTPTNGTLGNVVDADAATAGIQLTGTAASINAALAAATFTPTAAGAASIGISVTDGVASPVTGTYNLTAVAPNQAPTLAGIPTTSQFATVGQPATLADFTVADADSSNLRVTLTPTNGTLGNLSDADAATAGIQLTGTAASINAALAAATFTPTAAGSANIGISVSDGVASPVNGTYNLTAVAPNQAPTLAGIPSTTQSVIVGTPSALADFTVADAENNILRVTLRPTNGTLGNLTDADANTAGIQLIGTAASINLALANATFTPSAAGEASIGISLSDGVASPVTGTYPLSASTAPATNTNPTFSTGTGTGKTVVMMGSDMDASSPASFISYNVIRQSDGKLLMLGGNAGLDFSMVRFNDDGSLDSTFGTSGKLSLPLVFSGDVGSIQQADGKWVLVGTSFPGGDKSNFKIVRLNADGSLDRTFGDEGQKTVLVVDGFNHGQSVIQQADGKLVVAGYSKTSTAGSEYNFSVIRLNSDGNLDTTFSDDGKFVASVGSMDHSAFGIIQQGDGKLVLAGASQPTDATPSDYSLIRLNADGSLDTAFSGDGKLMIPMPSTDLGYSVIQQADGKLVMAGESSFSFGVIRVHTDGTLDQTFSGDGLLRLSLDSNRNDAYSVVQQADGKLVVLGTSQTAVGNFDINTLVRYTNSPDTNYDFSVIRLNADGSLDNSFSSDGVLNIPVGSGDDVAQKVIQQPDGKLILAGYSLGIADDNTSFSLVRLNHDGTLDTTFGGSATSTLGSTVSYTKGAAAILLDSSVELRDPELAALNNGAGNYSGASLTLARQGGANRQDVLGISTTGASFTISGSELQSGGLTFATFARSNGSLTINFTDSGTTPTQGLVNDVLSHITYQHGSSTPPASVKLEWNFSDGNSGSQGSGGALSATGTSTVNITAINTAPTITGIPTTAQNATVGQPAALADFTVADADGDNLTVTLTTSNGTLGNVTDADATTEGIQLTGTAANINAALANATFTPTAANGAGIGISVSDGVASPITETYVLTAFAANQAPTLAGIPTTAQSATVGQAAALVDFTLADADSSNLRVTLTPTNGTLGNLVDADAATAGIQLTGTAASINAALAAATFTPTAAGAASIGISLSDGVASPVTGTYNLTAATANLGTNTAPTFSPGSGRGKAVVPLAPGSNHDEAYSVVQQADGKLVVAGYSSTSANFNNDGSLENQSRLVVPNSHDFGLVRLNVDGSLDTSFGNQGRLIVPVGSGMDVAGSVIQQNDGKLVVAGYSQTGSQYVFSVIRLNADGSLDTSFGVDGKLLSLAGATSSEAYSVIQQTDGKLVVAGSGDGSGSDFSIIRLNADGSLDTTFSNDGKLLVPVGTGEDFGTSVIQQIDGKLVIAGRSLSGFAITYGVVRLNADGTLDTTFSDDGKFSMPVGSGGDDVASVIQQADGKLVVAGSSDNGNGGREFSLIRLNEDGRLDSSFGNGGTLVMHAGSGFSDDYGRSVIEQADGKLVVAGSSSGSSSGFSLIRLNTDGSLDTTFGDGGKLIQPVGSGDYLAYQVIQQADDKLVVVGSSTDGSGANKNFSLMRLNEDGSLDNTFVGSSAHTFAFTDYTEGAAAVVLDNAVQIQDAQLAALDGGSGNYSGAYIFVGRQGGARSQDVLGISTSGASFTISGSDLQSGGFTFATFAKTPGTLSIEFTDSGTTPTQALVNEVLSHITYANSSNTPPASVNLEWAFSDGNGGSQGLGGELTATGISTVNITAVNNTAPTLAGIPTTAQNATVGQAAALADFTVADADSSNLRVTLTPTNGTLGNLTDADAATAGIQLTGTAASINSAIAGATFSGTAAGAAHIEIRVDDDSGAAPVFGQYRLQVVGADAASNTQPTFSIEVGGRAISPMGPRWDDAEQLIQLADGQLLIVGTSTDNNLFDNFSLLKLTTDGRPDSGFGADGKVVFSVGPHDDRAFSMVEQANGKLVVAGHSVLGINTTGMSVVRLHADGSLDETFGSDGKFILSDASGRKVVLQPDNKLLVLGEVDDKRLGLIDKTNLNFLALRLNEDGTRDPSFGVNGVLTHELGDIVRNSVTVQNDGKFLVFGLTALNATEFGGTGYEPVLIRLLPDGSRDLDFGDNGIWIPPSQTELASKIRGYTVSAVAEEADGQLLLACTRDDSSYVGDFKVVRLQPDGALDRSFGQDGLQEIDISGGADNAYDLIVQPDGKVLLVGNGFNGSVFNFSAARLNSDGSLDGSFGLGGKLLGGSPGSAKSVIAQTDGKLVLAGSSLVSSSNTDFSVVRVNSDGSLDNTFATSQVNSLGGAANFTEGQQAVRIDSSVQVFDAELAALNGGLGDYSGASLTLARQGGASNQDVLGISSAGSSFTVSEANLQSAGQTFATFTRDSGTLRIQFTGIGTVPTQALVNDVLSHITYANSSSNPPASITMAWTFSDGNSDSQGAEGALSATGTTTVNIKGVNFQPTLSGLPGTAQSVTAGSAAALDDFSVADDDDDNLTVTLTPTNGTLGNVVDADANAAGIQLTGTAASINAAIAGATFVASQAGAANIAIRVSDGVAPFPTTDTYRMTAESAVAAPNSAPEILDLPDLHDVVTGAAVALADFAVADADGDNLTVTLTTFNGTLGSLTDADPNTNGLQLKGTAASINASLAGAMFVAEFDPAAEGTALINISVSDGVAAPTKGTYYLRVEAAANTAPEILGLPTNAPLEVVEGTPAALLNFAVDDAEGDNLTVTLTPTNGTLGNVTDTDANTAGIQLTGTAASINAALANVTFTATNEGAASIGVSLSDGVAAPVVGTYAMQAAAAPAYTPGQAVIDLGEYGQLINPVNVDGQFYYAWDLNGDGVHNNQRVSTGKFDETGVVANAAGSGFQFDFLTRHDVLDNLFVFQNDLATAKSVADTTNDHRFATLNGVQLALPTLGHAGQTLASNTFFAGTEIDNSPPGENNITYNDLLAVWDGHNGTQTTTQSNGLPQGWQSASYATATPSPNGHALFGFGSGFANDATDFNLHYVALQVMSLQSQ